MTFVLTLHIINLAAFAVLSRFRIFECTSPKLENIRSNPEDDGSAVRYCSHIIKNASFNCTQSLQLSAKNVFHHDIGLDILN